MNTALSQEKVTTLYFIRHCEKADDSKDTDLSEAGHARAQKWANYFKGKDIAAIYATPYKRTINTAAPLATQKKLTVAVYSPMELELDTITSKYKGRSVLIVGHSNTIPKYLNKLTGKKDEYKDIDEAEFSLLYTVTIKGETVTCTSEKI